VSAAAEPFDPSVLPDPHRVLLPSRAYLLSIRDQTLPVRRRALEDAEAMFDELTSDEGAGVRDMALLGLIGEAMQALEDLSYFGRAFENPLPHLPYYVTATVYSDRTPTNFFGSLPKWPDERFLVLAVLRVKDPAGKTLRVLEVLEAEDQFSQASLAAIAEAESATVSFLREALRRLAKTWTDFRPYFHAYKHGALLINRDDIQILEEDGAERHPSIAVWLRKKGCADPHVDTNLTPEEVAAEIAWAGRLALDVTQFLVDSRLRLFEQFEIDQRGQVTGLQMRTPLGFWFQEGDISGQSHDALEALGITFRRF